MTRLWPHGDTRIPGLRAAVISQAPTLFAKYRLIQPMEIANCTGEYTEECGRGFEVEYNMNYRASVVRAQWPSHFRMAKALAMQHQLRLIANQAYNGRMSNRPGTDDGWNPAAGDRLNPRAGTPMPG